MEMRKSGSSLICPALFFVLFALSGCAGGKFTEKKCLHGLIVNAGDIPVAGYEISVDRKIVGISDSRGLFEISLPDSDAVRFMGTKSGWKNLKAEEYGVDSSRLYVYRVESLGVTFSKIANTILSGDYQSALDSISVLESENVDERKINFLKSVVAFNEGRYEEAADYFDGAEIDLDKNPYLRGFEKKIGAELWDGD